MMRVVTASLLFTEKSSATFIPERLNIWESPVFRKTPQKRF